MDTMRRRRGEARLPRLMATAAMAAVASRPTIRKRAREASEGGGEDGDLGLPRKSSRRSGAYLSPRGTPTDA